MTFSLFFSLALGFALVLGFPSERERKEPLCSSTHLLLFNVNCNLSDGYTASYQSLCFSLAVPSSGNQVLGKLLKWAMAGSLSGDSGAGMSSEGISSGQRCQSGESLSEWRSSEQVKNGTPSTSPPYWDTDDDDISGAKPSELYGRFTWKMEQFPQITRRELRSKAFEVGGYKWYILIYPQGCDFCNHLSLFLCVANHGKLLPGWSHFAQFTIAVVNKDPKKSKYSDTLHRFWEKEHDWGWKKFIELSKVNDGFIVSDTLVIKAQVQVIREKAHRPFRCLDCQYRRELVRVYLSNVELICRRFVEEKRGALGKLIEDKVRWSSFRAFWFGVDQNARRHLSRDKQDAILKDVVKSFFIEKEVTSTLVMDSLYSGLRALECQNRNKKGTEKLVEMEETSDPIVFVEKDMFVLADDALALLERAAMEPLPPKDEKGPQNRTKEGSSGDDFSKDSIERDERRLTELGRRTVEIFVLAHIFSKIEAAYQDAVALRRQEELIREEEAAWQAETELKGKRGGAEKEKHAKKKQFPPSAAMQPGARYLQHQQAQSMTPQSLMAARSSMLYTQQPMSALQQQASLHSQLGMIPGGNNGLHMLHGDGSMGGNGGLAARGFPDFGRSAGESLHAATSRGMTGTGKQDVGNAGSAEGRGGSAGGQNTDGTEPLYLKSSEEAN